MGPSVNENENENDVKFMSMNVVKKNENFRGEGVERTLFCTFCIS